MFSGSPSHALSSVFSPELFVLFVLFVSSGLGRGGETMQAFVTALAARERLDANTHVRQGSRSARGPNGPYRRVQLVSCFAGHAKTCLIVAAMTGRQIGVHVWSVWPHVSDHLRVASMPRRWSPVAPQPLPS
ncbi:hypothetical protein K402DRAFT_46273 [Aulographum hederae CBS 113979]|uniref:Secreted protein n=1 Tax=Aulographum hederae CBS 113979 TaxID=1176131 RepID=A0A6G1H419_9PEZI|nr:hypothetical protein K402DRAFT_46273 [Aulographum hederae CBS 113979]